MSVPQWVIDAAFVILIMWFVDREIGKLKTWVEELVGFVRHKDKATKTAAQK